jgi:hypothetical protein
MKKLSIIAFGLIISLGVLQSCQSSTSAVGNSTGNIDSLKKVAMELVASSDTIASHLKTFDELDFDVFSNQKWDSLKESHAQNIKVFWSDGHVTEGLDKHIEDMKIFLCMHRIPGSKSIPSNLDPATIRW